MKRSIELLFLITLLVFFFTACNQSNETTSPRECVLNAVKAYRSGDGDMALRWLTTGRALSRVISSANAIEIALVSKSDKNSLVFIPPLLAEGRHFGEQETTPQRRRFANPTKNNISFFDYERARQAKGLAFVRIHGPRGNFRRSQRQAFKRKSTAPSQIAASTLRFVRQVRPVLTLIGQRERGSGFVVVKSKNNTCSRPVFYRQV